MTPTPTSAKILAPCLAFAVLACPGAAKDARHSDDDDGTARAAYPRPFSRPPKAGNDYDTWRGAAGPDVGTAAADPARLPPRVDNSTRPEFPGIYKQKWGTCGQFASVATVFTYEMNVLNGTAADRDATRFPAHFSWNMMNQAKNQGSEAYHGWEVAKRVGIPTAATYGGVRLDTIGLWPKRYEVWREAMEYRVAGYRYTPATSVGQLNEARGWLFDRNRPGGKAVGGLLAMDGRMGEKEKVTMTIADGEHRAGEDVWIRWGPSGYGHGLACVGYDDEVGYDVNDDGRITNDLDLNGDGEVTLADWERGAYIVANSWGEKWSKDGRIYLLYSAMIDPTWKRGNYLGRVEVTRHSPRMTLRLKLSCDDRSDLRTTIGLAGDPVAGAAAHEIAPEAFNGWPLFGGSGPGRVPLAGPDDPSPIEVGIDLTPLLDELGPDADGEGRLFLNLGRADKSKAAGELHEAFVRHYNDKGKLLSESPLEIKDGRFGDATFQLAQPVRLPARASGKAAEQASRD
jgi:hypothetical protein